MNAIRVLLFVALASPVVAQSAQYFAIHVVDEQAQRGVPLVELTTTHNVHYYTDSGGWIAFSEPGLMDREVFFHVRSHGYEYPKDGFGFAGVRLTPRPGESAEIKIKRINIAERLYRLTGGGIHRDTVLLGKKPPIEQPVLNAQVFGQDSVLNAIYHGKLFWIWGDTNRPSYPLGLFHAPGALSKLPNDGGLDPEVGVNLDYFKADDGFAKPLARLPGEGAVWMDGLVTLQHEGRERLLAAFARVPGLATPYERGFVEFNDETQVFEKVGSFDVNAPSYPGGHPLRVGVGNDDYFYFSRGVVYSRVRAARDAYLDINRCESYTCLADGSTLADPKIDRDDEGAVRYEWRTNTPALYAAEQASLVKAGLLKPAETLSQTRDILTGKPVLVHGGSTYWNEYRKRWVAILSESWGSTMLGEVWYAEADTPRGPWVYARKIITHDKYSFYNPRQHVEFDADGGRLIYLEGTYTSTFSGNENPTPWYDYNQIMYRLDLADPRLVLPTPVYEIPCGGGARYVFRDAVPADAKAFSLAFFACDRPAPDLIPIYATYDAAGAMHLSARKPDAEQPAVAFFARAEGAKPEQAPTAPLHQLTNSHTLEVTYATPRESHSDYEVSPTPACYVWPNPHARAIRLDPREESPRTGR